MADIVFGSPVKFEDATTLDTVDLSKAIDLGSNKIAIAYRDQDDTNAGKVIVGTISGTVITWGSPSTFAATLSATPTALAKLDTDKLVVFYSNGDMFARAVTVSGTVVGSWGTEVLVSGTTGTNNRPAACQLGTDKAVVTWRRSTTPTREVSVCTVSGTTITVGTPVIFTSVDTGSPSVCKLDTDKFVVSYHDFSANKVYAIAATVSGTVPTFGSVIEVGDQTVDSVQYESVVEQLTTDTFAITWRDDTAGTTSGKTRVGTTSGTVITLGTTATFSANTIEAVSSALIDTSTYVIVFVDSNDTNKGKSCVVVVSGTTATPNGSFDTFDAGDTGRLGAVLLSSNKIGITYEISPDGWGVVGDMVVPTVTSCTPNSGSTAGGTSITDLAGTNFVTGATVTFGGVAATDVTVVSAIKITCTTPAHAAGAVNIVVTNPNSRTGTLSSGFTYTGANPPAISGIDPESGPTAGGTSITITGTDFVDEPTVTFGGEAATNVVFVSSTEITCNTPAHAAGAVDVVVTNPDEQSDTLAGGFTYIAPPTVSSCTPSTGSTSGGTSITDLAGTGFLAGASVTFGGTSATDVVVVSSIKITCTTPAHAAGAVDIVVTNTDTQSGTLGSGFTYEGEPAAPGGAGMAAKALTGWKVRVLNSTGKIIANLIRARDIRVGLRLSGTPSASFKLDIDDPKADDTTLSTGVNDIEVLRDGVVIFRGRIWNKTKNYDGDDGDVQVDAYGYFALLDKRLAGKDEPREFDSTDAGTIVSTLISESQAETGGNLGIINGTIQTSTNRTRSYRYKRISEAITELADAETGFDFEITPDNVFNVYYPFQGSTKRNIIFKYPGAIERVEQIDQSGEIINFRVGLGKAFGETEIRTRDSDADSILQYGRREDVSNYRDVDNVTTLGNMIAGDILRSKNLVAVYRITINQDSSDYEWGDWGIGDSVVFKVDTDKWILDKTLRILAIEFQVDDEGRETVVFTTGEVGAEGVAGGANRPTEVPSIPAEIAEIKSRIEKTELNQPRGDASVIVAPDGDDGDFIGADGIQSAINFVNSLGGGTVLTKAGTYTLTANLTIAQNVNLVGVGQSSSPTASTIINTSGFHIDFVSETSDPEGVILNSSISNMRINGTLSGGTPGGLIDLGNIEENFSLNVRIFDISFTGMSNSAKSYIRVDANANIQIYNCNSISGTGHFIDLDDTIGLSSKNIIIFNNFISSARGIRFDLNPAVGNPLPSGITIISNIFECSDVCINTASTGAMTSIQFISNSFNTAATNANGVPLSAIFQGNTFLGPVTSNTAQALFIGNSFIDGDSTTALTIGASSVGTVVSSNRFNWIGGGSPSGNTGISITASASGTIISGNSMYNQVTGISDSGTDTMITSDDGAGEINWTADAFQFNTDSDFRIVGLLQSGTAGVPVHFSTSTDRIYGYTSSNKFKDDIKDLEIDSSRIYDIKERSFTPKPVKGEPKPGRGFGLIAEEVEKVAPELVIHDAKGDPIGIHYELLSILQNKELKKLREEVDKLKMKYG